MKEKRSASLVQHFLRSSPQNELKKYKKIFWRPLVLNKTPISPITNRAYVEGFLKALQVFGTPASQLKRYPSDNQIHFSKIIRQQRMSARAYQHSSSEQDQLLLCIKEMTIVSSISLISYQELEQRIVIAKPATISHCRSKLTYLFKILLSKRDKLALEGLELQANLQLSQVIIDAFARHAEHASNKQQWSKLQAMEKLLQARQDKKKGLDKLATSSFIEIFRDDAATYQTRLQALKIICLEGQQLGDSSQLQSLVSLVHEKGEKEYEQYLRVIIERIKKGEDQAKLADK